MDTVGKPKIIAVIPCYNEEFSIADVVKLARKYVDAVVVADDGSIDRTAEVAYGDGASVIQSTSRKGVGANTALGIQRALWEKDCDVVVTLDGDGQHNASEIPKVIESVLEGKADLAVGVRPMRLIGGDGMPRYRKFGIDVITWLFNVGARQKLADGQCCFRAYSRRLLKAVAIEERGFGFSTEIPIKARALGFRIVEVPVSCVYRRGTGLDSTMNPVLHGLGVALATIKWRIKTELFRNGRS